MRVGWHRIATLGAVAAVAAVTVSGAGSQGRSAIRLTDSTPVVVRGSGFEASERVRVRVRVKGSVVYGKTVAAGRRGGFVARFAGHAMPRCVIYVITATGSKGSSARLRSPMSRVCGPPPQP